MQLHLYLESSMLGGIRFVGPVMSVARMVDDALEISEQTEI